MPSALELAARFINALYDLTRGRLGQARKITDVARRARIKNPAPIVQVAERAGFLDVRVDDPQYVVLTSKGIETVRLSNVRRPYDDGKP